MIQASAPSRPVPTATPPASAPTAGRQRVGVIVPVYNRPRIVLDAIDCVARQTRRPDRLVLVDDGSTDGTPDHIQRRLAELDLPFAAVLVKQARGGVSAARNRAAKLCADCDVLAMIDSDDLWPDDYLERMVRPLIDDPGVAASFCDQVFVDLRTGERRRRDLSIYATDTTRRMFLYGPPTPSCTVVRGELFRRLGGYDQTLTCSEDYDLHLKLSLEGRWAHVPGPGVQIRRATGVDDETAHHLTEIGDARIAVQRAGMLERFARELGGRRAMPWRAWRTGLASQWTRRGDAFRAAGERQHAAWCYRRAVTAAPWRAAAWRGYATTRFAGAPLAPPLTMRHDEARL